MVDNHESRRRALTAATLYVSSGTSVEGLRPGLDPRYPSLGPALPSRAAPNGERRFYFSQIWREGTRGDPRHRWPAAGATSTLTLVGSTAAAASRRPSTEGRGPRVKGRDQASRGRTGRGLASSPAPPTFGTAWGRLGPVGHPARIRFVPAASRSP